MTFDDFQQLSTRTRRKMTRRDALANGGMGLAGEAGEVADGLKKHLYQGHDLDMDALTKELGDVLWYAADTATTLGLSLSDIAARNVAKLAERFPNGFEEKRSRLRLVEVDGQIGGIHYGSQNATAQDVADRHPEGWGTDTQ